MTFFNSQAREEWVALSPYAGHCMVGHEMKRLTSYLKRQPQLLDGWRYLVGHRLVPFSLLFSNMGELLLSYQKSASQIPIPGL